jgi:hypothetical protein
MGFVIQSAEERNPIKNQQVVTLEKEVAMLNEFLELIGRAHIYDSWKHDQLTGEKTIDVTEWEASQPKIEDND